MHMHKTDLQSRIDEKIALDCQIYVPSGAQTNVPEQHATWPTESNFDLAIAVSDSNESPNQILHEAHVHYWTYTWNRGENVAWMSKFSPKPICLNNTRHDPQGPILTWQKWLVRPIKALAKYNTMRMSITDIKPK